MRLLIDLQCLQTSSRFRGIGHYVSSLLKALLQVNQQRQQPHDIIVLLNNYQPELIQDFQQHWSSLLPPGAIRVFHALPETAELSFCNPGIVRISEQLRNEFIERLNPDFVLISSLFEGMADDFVCDIPRNRSCPVGVIGYDLIPLISPREYLGDPVINRWYRRKIDSLQRVDRVFAISESASREFETHLELPEGSVATISTGCDQGYYPLGETDEIQREVLRELGISGPFILYSGASDERKNLNALVQAFNRLSVDLKKSLRLVLVGKFNEVDQARLSQYAKTHGIPPRHILYTGFVPQQTLNILYNHCQVFVFPSRHEGFGLPVLEAMTCGAPALCANTTSLPEVMGLEAAMFGPDDIPRLTQLITRVVTEPDFRQQLIDHGLERSRRFSWHKTATELLHQIEQTIDKHRGSPPGSTPSNGSSSADTKRIETLAQLCQRWKLDDRQLRQLANALAANDLALTKILPQRQYNWRLEGPFDSSYSLALLNRETARGLAAIGQPVSLHSTEGPGDFEPSPAFLADNPDIAYMHSLSHDKAFRPTIISRNLYPPRVNDMAEGAHLLHHYAWEEAGFPQEWVEDFNRHLTGITCLSEHVRKVLIDNGVCLPMSVSGCGVDHWDRVVPKPYPLQARAFRFLHVSSCFPRKGVDALLEAWGQAFSDADNVSLVIKTFENPHNNVQDLLAAQRRARPDYPDVVIISEDLPAGQLKYLYENCQALVAPSKAEGFGLPLAEAMLSGLPVITTGWSGQLDFCDHDTAWLTKFHFEPAQTHFQLPDSVWASPDTEHLASQLCEVYALPPSERRRKTAAAIQRLREQFTWEQVALRLANQADDIIQRRQNEDIQRPLRVGWVSTWNQRCGVATYSEHLTETNKHDQVIVFAPHNSGSDDSGNGPQVIRCWHQNDQDPLHELASQLLAAKLDAVVIQMNYYFFDFDALAQLIATLKASGIVVTFTLHSTVDPEPRKALTRLARAAELADRVLVHTVPDLNRLAQAGIVSNTLLMPHGIADIEPEPVEWNFNGRPCIASYGFALPHKGLEQLIEAFAQLHRENPQLVLLLLNAEHQDPVSAQFIKTLHQRIGELGIADAVHAEHRFLRNGECLGLLQQASVIALPYQQTGESSSAAVRMAIASGRPVLVTPLPIFGDVEPAVAILPGTSAEAIRDGLAQALAGQLGPDPERLRQWRESRAYPVVAKRTFNLLRSLWLNR